MTPASGPPRSLPTELHSYLQELLRRTRAVCGDHLVGVLAVGSLALGDYRHGRSDIDLTVVVEPSLPGSAPHDLAGTLAHPALPCPAAGLELVVYGADFARRPSGEAGYLLDLNTGPSLPDRADTDPARSPAFWYVIDRSIAHHTGLPLLGGPARDLVAAPDRRDVLAAVRASVVEHSGGEGHLADNRVLNGCRAVVFCRTGRWVAKRTAAREIVAAEERFRPLVDAAVHSFERPRALAVALPDADVRTFLGWVRERVEEAARTAGA
ncbi:aminoglycoside adenylyltransferase domain-containing protein [Streptomyces cucumeris]|uniref:aminoglycoside adenylyltransferase domain-containing protein n=1 Tax=Streptomyces cucumeris TaxID=2962890 RepID=UPI003D724EF8